MGREKGGAEKREGDLGDTEMKVIGLTFKEAVEIAKRIGVEKETTDYKDNTVVLHLKDGSRLRFKSEYDGPWSEVTPGDGIQPPTCTHERD
jgi:hypothetical protein